MAYVGDMRTRNARFTPKQRQAYDFIRSYEAEHGYAPSLKEIGDHMGLSAVSTVHEHLTNLEAKGFIRREERIPRSAMITVRPPAPAVELQLLGSVVAGPPTESFAAEEAISVPRDMVGRGAHFALRVMGESMCDENITPGDVLVVQQTSRAERGALVVALVEGRETTVKRFFPERNHVRLQPSNRSMAPIRVPKAAVQVQGVVVGLLRNYRRP